MSTTDQTTEPAATPAAAPPSALTATLSFSFVLTHLDFDPTSPVWGHIWRDLASEYFLVRYDGRGSGLSDRELATYSFDSWVDDLEAVVDELGLERFPLLGISQGGPIAVTYASRHPEKVTHLILLGAYGRGRLERSLARGELHELRILGAFAEQPEGERDGLYEDVLDDLPDDGTDAELRIVERALDRHVEVDHAVDVLEQRCRKLDRQRHRFERHGGRRFAERR